MTPQQSALLSEEQELALKRAILVLPVGDCDRLRLESLISARKAAPSAQSEGAQAPSSEYAWFNSKHKANCTSFSCEGCAETPRPRVEPSAGEQRDVATIDSRDLAEWLDDFVRGECMFRSDEKPAMFVEIAKRLRLSAAEPTATLSLSQQIDSAAKEWALVPDRLKGEPSATEDELRAIENGASKLVHVAEYECQDEETSAEYRRDARTLRSLASRLTSPQRQGEWMDSCEIVEAFKRGYQTMGGKDPHEVQQLAYDCAAEILARRPPPPAGSDGGAK